MSLLKTLIRQADENGVEVLRHCEFINIDQVALYYYMEEKQIWQWEDFFNVAPPFASMFFEYVVPEYINLGNREIEKTNAAGVHWGYIVNAIEHPCCEPRWELYTNAFTGGAGGWSRHWASCVLPVNDGGEFNAAIFGKRKILWDREVGEEMIEKLGKAPTDFLDPLLLALQFMNCRGVELVDATPKQKKRKARNRWRGITWKRLVIHPAIEKIRQESGHSGLRLGLHVCRGHFKDYRESGLFGQHKGVYWWHEQARGAARYGITLKDYEIKTGEPELEQGDLL